MQQHRVPSSPLYGHPPTGAVLLTCLRGGPQFVGYISINALNFLGFGYRCRTAVAIAASRARRNPVAGTTASMAYSQAMPCRPTRPCHRTDCRLGVAVYAAGQRCPGTVPAFVVRQSRSNSFPKSSHQNSTLCMRSDNLATSGSLMPRSREQPLQPAAVAGLSSPRSSSRTPGITVPKSILVTDSSLQGAPLAAA